MRPGPVNAWVLLRGLARESAHWGDFTALFAARMAPLPVIALDLPGNGQARALRSPTRVADYVPWLREALAAQGVRPPIGVVAMSLGAMVTVAWAEQHPQDLAAAVLINTSLRGFAPFYRRLQPQAWAWLLRAACARDALARERAVWQATSRGPADRREAVVQRWAAIHHARPVAAGNVLRQLWAAARFHAPAEAPAVPLLLLSSARDALAHPACSAAIAQAWGVPHAVHPWAGHDLPLDDAAWVVEQVAGM